MRLQAAVAAGFHSRLDLQPRPFCCCSCSRFCTGAILACLACTLHGDCRFYTSTWAREGPDVTLTTMAAGNTAYRLALPAAVVQAVHPGSWHHVALTANETACTLAVDGNELGSQPCNVSLLLPSVVSRQGMKVQVGGFDGWLDELRLSSVVRRTQAPNAAAPPPQPPPATPSSPPDLPSCFWPLVDSSTVLLKVSSVAWGSEQLSGCIYGCWHPSIGFCHCRPTHLCTLPVFQRLTPDICSTVDASEGLQSYSAAASAQLYSRGAASKLADGWVGGPVYIASKEVSWP